MCIRDRVIDQQMIQTLPLNRRDFLQLALLAPGASPAVEGSQLSENGGTSLEVNGGREEYNNFLLDGADNNDPYVSGYVVQPAVDSVQEFKMVTSSYDAEYGRSAAGQVNVITRRGTNEFHGTAYAVSYTHLDVYKRQAWKGRGSTSKRRSPVLTRDPSR